MLPTNLNKAEFLKGYREVQKRAGMLDNIGSGMAAPFKAVGNTLSNFGQANMNAAKAVGNFATAPIRNAASGAMNLASKPINWATNKINNQVEGYLGNRMGAAMKPTLDSARQAGVQFDTNAQGLPVNFDTNATVNNVAKNYVSNAGNEITGWLGKQWDQIKSSPMDWAKNNPWLAGGAAALGGAGLYGAGRLAFGGEQQQQAPQAYGVPQPMYYGPQAIQKESELLPLLSRSLNLPNQFANGFPRQQAPQQQQEEAYNPNFIADDQRVQKLLEDPQMRNYLVGLINQRNG